MRVFWSVRRWLRLPSRIALLLGLGALSAAAARADTGLDQAGEGIAPLAHRDQASLGDLVIRTEGGRIYLSEGGGEFHELRLRDIGEAHLLQQLVQRNGATVGAAGIRLAPTILAGDGGAGFHWPPTGKLAPRDQPGSVGSRTPAAGTPAPPNPPQTPGAPGKATIGRAGEKG
jgi:hypothetical protein